MRTLLLLPFALFTLAACDNDSEPEPVPPPENPAPAPAEEAGTSIEVDGSGVRIDTKDGELDVNGDSAIIRVEPKK